MLLSSRFSHNSKSSFKISATNWFLVIVGFSPPNIDPAIFFISSGKSFESVLKFTPIPTTTFSTLPLSKFPVASVNMPQIFLSSKNISLTHFILGLF